MTLRDTVLELTPPLLLRAVRSALGHGLRFDGRYATWADAQKASGGYDSNEIVRRVLEAELKVKRGETADARDGVTFSEVQFALPVMAALARVTPRHGATLRVLDIGGAFGRLYRQFKAFLPGARVSWSVVEQAACVALGKQHFENAELRFFSDMNDIGAREPADVALLCSALQYFSEPYALIGRLAASGVRHVVIDRTPCSALEHDIVSVQRVPAEIYRASYPCWIFSRTCLVSAFASSYATVASFSDGSGPWRSGAVRFHLCGFIFDRRTG